MTEDEVFERTGDAYLCLIHPVTKDQAYRHEIAPVLALSVSVPEALVSRMIVGISWRERLLGLSLAMTKRPEVFADQMLASLSDVRGISIVPTCAALAVLGRRGLFDIRKLLTNSVDRTAFDNEVGWAVDQAKAYTEGKIVSGGQRGPNYGQFFAHQIEVYEWILNSQPYCSYEQPASPP